MVEKNGSNVFKWSGIFPRSFSHRSHLSTDTLIRSMLAPIFFFIHSRGANDLSIANSLYIITPEVGKKNIYIHARLAVCDRRRHDQRSALSHQWFAHRYCYVFICIIVVYY